MFWPLIPRDIQDTEAPNLHFLEGTTKPVGRRGNHQSSSRIADKRGCSILMNIKGIVHSKTP